MLIEKSGIALAAIALSATSCRRPEGQLSEYKDGNLPVIVVHTSEREIRNGPKTEAHLRVTTPPLENLEQLNQDTPELSATVGIEFRGYSSQRFPKKQYALEFWDDDQEEIEGAILGMPAHTDWVLHAPYMDKSLIRNHFVYELGRALGATAPQTRFVELFVSLDDEPDADLMEYRGIYVVTEAVGPELEGIGILPHNSLAAEPEANGYLLEVTQRSRVEKDEPSFVSNCDLTMLFKYPKARDLTSSEISWISSDVRDFEDALTDDGDGYLSFIDLQSFVDFILINELVKNHDAFTASTFIHKRADGLFGLGPLWDFDRSIGDVKFAKNWKTTGFLLPKRGWGVPLHKQETFLKAYVTRWEQLREDVLSTQNLHDRIDAAVTELGPAIDRNFEKWLILGKYVRANKRPLARTHPEEIRKMKTWLQERAAWMDEHVNLDDLRDAARD